MASTPSAGDLTTDPAAGRPRPGGSRVLLLNPSYPPVRCGIGNYTHGLAEALSDAGNDVTVLTSTDSESDRGGSPRVLAELAEWDVRSFLKAWPEVRRTRPDVVVASFPAIVPGRYSRLLYLGPALAKVLLGRPRVVFVVHEFVRIGDAERRWLRLAFRASDRIVTVTEAERDAVLARYPSLASRITVCHNPSTVPAVPEDPDEDARLRHLHEQEGRPLVAFIGLLNSPAKGLEDLLEAVAQTDAALLATGSLDPAQELHAHVAAVVERLGLRERVHWLGHVEDEEVGRLLRVADVVALPYRGGAESGYTSLLAAIVNGAAVVTTDGPGRPSWLRHEETALLVEPSRPDQLAAAIRRLTLDGDLNARVRAGAGGLEFGWDRLTAVVLSRDEGFAPVPGG